MYSLVRFQGAGEKRVRCVHFAEGESDSQVGGFTSWEHGSVIHADETEWTKPLVGLGKAQSAKSIKVMQASEHPEGLGGERRQRGAAFFDKLAGGLTCMA